MPEWAAFIIGASSFLLGMGFGAFGIAIFAAKDVGKLEEERAENQKLRHENVRLRRLVGTVTEDVAK